MARLAPVGILVCGDLPQDTRQGNWVQGCSNCAMNMLLAAHALGLGAVWTGSHPMGQRGGRAFAPCAASLPG